MKILFVAKHNSGDNDDLDINLPNHPSPRSRFFQRVNKDGPVHPRCGQCWQWTGRKTRGYGVLTIRGKKTKAHRLSWIIHCGEIPSGKLVRHKCDTPSCVNPRHLELGTDGDNVRDSSIRGRISRGESRPASKLTESQVKEIRRRYKKISNGHGNGAALAREFGVSTTAIQYAVSGRNWRYLR